jgi:hypothetical protein
MVMEIPLEEFVEINGSLQDWETLGGAVGFELLEVRF